MPQVAQQDYLFIKARVNINADAAVLSALVKAIENHTIFDIILDLTTTGTGTIVRVLSYFYEEGEGGVGFYDDATGEINTALLYYTAMQYEGLAAVQDGFHNYSDMPTFTDSDGLLYENENGGYVTIDGKAIAVTVKNDVIASLAQSDIEEPADISGNITWEDAQKLIGLPIT